MRGLAGSALQRATRETTLAPPVSREEIAVVPFADADKPEKWKVDSPGDDRAVRSS
jgi:hypothetical protein